MAPPDVSGYRDSPARGIAHRTVSSSTDDEVFTGVTDAPDLSFFGERECECQETHPSHEHEDDDDQCTGDAGYRVAEKRDNR
jgi:hypothetical protein